MIQRCSSACARASCRKLFREHVLCTLLCLGRRTLPGVISTSGKQYQDWSAQYRLYSKNRVDPEKCFESIRECVESKLPCRAPLVVAIDDTIKPKCGTRIDGVSYRRDPLGPRFQTNLVRAQRFLQFSAAVSFEDGSALTIPIDFQHAPSAKKPGAKADAHQVSQYKEQCKQLNLNKLANERIASLRAAMDPNRRLVLVVDGSYTNGSVIKNLPEDVSLIGRIRKDAVLTALPGQGAKTGRRRLYGGDMPTPEDIRKDEAYEWIKVGAFASGRIHSFKIKVVKNLLWRKCGAERQLQLVTIAPLGYRLRKNSRALYRQPAYLICSDAYLDIQSLLQYYLWRWQIEVNFRDEKSLLGMGEAQVRTAASNKNLPAINVASYSMLWLAALEMDPQQRLAPVLPPPKWRRDLQGKAHPSTSQLLHRLRHEAWAGSITASSFSHFANQEDGDAKSEKPAFDLPSALFQAA